MDKNRIIQYLLFLLFFAFITSGKAQQVYKADTVNNALRTEKVDVIKSFEAQLAEARMLPINPRPPEKINVDKNYLYQVSIIPYDIQYPEPVIRPLAMRKDQPSSHYKSRIKGGYGNLNNLYADLRFYKSVADINDWNLNLNYSKLDNTEELNNQKYATFFASTQLGIPVFETSKVDLSLSGGIDKRYFYYHLENEINDLSEEEALRETGKFGGKVSFYNTHQNISDIDYKFSFEGNYTNISDIDENEFFGLLSGHLTKRSGNGISFTISGGGDLNSSFGNNDMIGFFNPNLKVNKSKVSVKAGINYLYANEESYLFPNAEVQYALSGNKLQIFTGANQYYRRNNMYTTTQYNPFAVGFDSVNTTVTKDIYLGFKGVVQQTTYQFKGGMKDLNDQVYFNTEFQDSLKRIGIYNTDLRSIYVSAALQMNIGSSSEIGGSITQHFFRDLTIEELWHIPSLELNAYGVLKLIDEKLKIRTDLFLRNSAKVQTLEGVRNLENMIDLNLEVEYLPIEKFGVYIKGKNLLDKGYRRWYSYPVLGIHMEGGIIFRF